MTSTLKESLFKQKIKKKNHSSENCIAGLIFLNEMLITELTKPEHFWKACISLPV